MAPQADPYRTLGLARGASTDDIKRAYRRLAKINHPDAAGEAALPRFLAIQAAYEQLVGGRAPAPGGARRAGQPPRPSQPWGADPDRRDATDRAYGGRTRGSGPGGTGAAPGAGGAGGSGRAGGAGGAAGGAQGAEGAGAPGAAGRGRAYGGSTGRPGRRRPADPKPDPPPGATDETSRGTKGRRSKKATMGSTSYDGTDPAQFEPDWGGASWYGTTSGTYWTLNPKEYADPRKHGPEYQARARRMRERGEAAGPDSATEPATDARPPDSAVPPPDPAARPPEPTHTTSSWWESTAGPRAESADPAPGARTSGPSMRPPGPRREPEPPPPDLGRAASDIGRALTDERLGGWRGRVIRAIIGWIPIALGLGWLIGEVTGCGRFAASCAGVTGPLLLVGQLAILGVLMLVPVLASIATMASLTVLAVSVLASLVLSSTGQAADEVARQTTLGVVLVAAWIVGVTIPVVRRVRELRSPASPVS